MYPAGWFGWKTLAKIGVPIIVTFAIAKDPETNLYIGKSVGLKGVFAEAETLDELSNRLKSAFEDIIELELCDGDIDVTTRYEENDKLAFV